MFVGAVYDRAPFLESTKYARSQTAPTANAPLLGQAPHEEGIAVASDFMCKAGDRKIRVRGQCIFDDYRRSSGAILSVAPKLYSTITDFSFGGF
jgi:hypothetical protein